MRPKRQVTDVRVRFPLDERDQREGVEAENLWAEPIDNGSYIIDSIPFYIYGVSYGDIVSAQHLHGTLSFDRVLKRGGHSTYRVLVNSSDGYENLEWVRRSEQLRNLGCSFEIAKRRWIAIDVPKSADADAVYSVLEKGEDDGAWSFEQGHSGHPTVPVN